MRASKRCHRDAPPASMLCAGCWAGVAVVFLALAPAQGRELHVDWAGGGDYTTITAAVTAASAGDTVVVACGTYSEPPRIDIRKDISLRSETRDPECVTLDGLGTFQIMASHYMTSRSYIEGFTFVNGYQAALYSDAGALGCSNTAFTLRNCIFRNNVSANTSGGAISVTKAMIVENCQFYGNSAPSQNCSFANCGVGGALYLNGSNSGVATIRDCVFVDNYAGRNGGGIGTDYGGCPTRVERCTFVGNSAPDGGALDAYDSTFTIRNCSFAGNECLPSSGTVVVQDHAVPLTMEKSIVASSVGGAAVVCTYGASSTVSCSDFFGNAGGDWTGCVSGQLGVDGNICSDPLFCEQPDPENPLTIHANSPCAPEYSPCGQLIGSGDVGCGASAVLPLSWGRLKALYR